MNTFLLMFFLIYGSVHVYAFVRVRQAFLLGSGAGALLAILFVLMILAPVVVRVTEREGFDLAARVIAYLGYTWMGFLFLYFSASLVFDCYLLGLKLFGMVSSTDTRWLTPSPRTAFIGPLLYAFFAAAYGYFEAQAIRTKRVVVESPKVPVETKFTVAQVSDVHIGLIVRRNRLSRIAEAVRQANPDLVVSTGDLVDGQLDDIGRMSDQFIELHPRFGMFAVTGNHEYYAGLGQSLNFTNRAGFRVLRDEILPVTDWLSVAGVDDPAGGGWKRHGLSSIEEKILGSLPRERFVLLLKHRPAITDQRLGRCDLQLSGHVHKGQMFPFNLVTYLFYPVRTGLSRLTGGGFLYVSRGTGTWGPPIRFLAPPEVTLFELVHGEHSAVNLTGWRG